MKKINTLQLVIAFTFFLVSCNKRGSGMAEADYDVIPLLTFDPVTAHYFRITVKLSVIPEWHPGKGNRAFIFVDEIRLD